MIGSETKASSVSYESLGCLVFANDGLSLTPEHHVTPDAPPGKTRMAKAKFSYVYRRKAGHQVGTAMSRALEGPHVMCGSDLVPGSAANCRDFTGAGRGSWVVVAGA